MEFYSGYRVIVVTYLKVRLHEDVEDIYQVTLAFELPRLL